MSVKQAVIRREGHSPRRSFAEKVISREEELTVLVSKREEEFALAMAHRKEEIMEAVQNRAQQLCDAWTRRGAEIGKEVEEGLKSADERIRSGK